MEKIRLRRFFGDLRRFLCTKNRLFSKNQKSVCFCKSRFLVTKKLQKSVVGTKITSGNHTKIGVKFLKNLLFKSFAENFFKPTFFALYRFAGHDEETKIGFRVQKSAFLVKNRTKIGFFGCFLSSEQHKNRCEFLVTLSYLRGLQGILNTPTFILLLMF